MRKESGVPPTVRSILHVLAAHQTVSGDQWSPSQQQICDESGWTMRPVRTALAWAEHHGWIKRTFRGGYGQAWRHTEYQPTIPAWVLAEMMTEDAERYGAGAPEGLEVSEKGAAPAAAPSEGPEDEKVRHVVPQPLVQGAAPPTTRCGTSDHKVRHQEPLRYSGDSALKKKPPVVISPESFKKRDDSRARSSNTRARASPTDPGSP